MVNRKEAGLTHLKAAELFQKKAEDGEIGFFGISPKDLSLMVAPTYLILDPRVLDEFRRGLIPDHKPVFEIDSAGRIPGYPKWLPYGESRFEEERGTRICVRVLPDDQLAESVLTWESEVGEKYPTTSLMAGLARALDKDQLVFLREDPQGFNQKLKRYLELMRKKPPYYGFLPVGGSMSYQRPFTGISIPGSSRIP